MLPNNIIIQNRDIPCQTRKESHMENNDEKGTMINDQIMKREVFQHPRSCRENFQTLAMRLIIHETYEVMSLIISSCITQNF